MDRLSWRRRKPPAWLDDGEDVPENFAQRPRTRADCREGARPCAWVGCRYHLYLDVGRGGEIISNFKHPPWLMKESCALDVADRAAKEGRGTSLEKIGRLYGVTRQAIQIIMRRTTRRFRGVAERLMAIDDPDGDVSGIGREVYQRGIKAGLHHQKLANASDFIGALRMTHEEKQCLARILTARG